MQLGKGALLRGRALPALRPHQGCWVSAGGSRTLSLVRGSRTMAAPSASPGYACLPSPSPGLTVRALGGMHPAEIPQGFVPPGRKRKGRGGLPLPMAKEAAAKLGWPSGSGAGVEHTWDPGSGAELLGACCRETLSLQQGCHGGLASEAGDDPQGPPCLTALGSALVLRQAECSGASWRASVSPWHVEQGPKGRGEGGVSYHVCSSQGCCSFYSTG